MQIVIDISEEEYNRIKENDCGLYNGRFFQMIRNGTPLPERHGDLKDMGNLPYVFDLTIEDPIYSGKDIEQVIKSMTTIIPADTESGGEQ